MGQLIPTELLICFCIYLIYDFRVGFDYQYILRYLYIPSPVLNKFNKQAEHIPKEFNLYQN